MAGGHVDAFVLSAQRKFGLRIEFETVVEKPLGHAELGNGRLRFTAIGKAVIGQRQPGAQINGFGAIFDARLPGLTARAAGEVVFLPRAADNRQRFTEAQTPVEAIFAGAGFGGVDLADAKARLLFAGICEDVVFGAVMFGFDQPGVCGTG